MSPGTPALALASHFAPDTDQYAARATRDIKQVVVHRIAVSVEDPAYGDSPSEVMRFFREHPVGVKASGGKMPYSILIDKQGVITQTVPLGRVTPHAVRYNPTAIGVACIGDFRSESPSPAQKRALVQVCTHLLLICRLDTAALLGHDELPGGSHDPDKQCPGRLLDLAALRDIVAAALAFLRGERADFAW